MTIEIRLDPQQELAGAVPIDASHIRRPQYGRYLDDLVPGQVFVHPRGYTFERAGMLDFARTFMQANPLYLNAEYARAGGFSDLPASPQMVFNVVLSLGVQNDSEKVIANLGYYNAQFLLPVYPGDTLRAFTQVVERKERGPDKPGIVLIRTLGVNQRGEVVLQYERKLLAPWRGDKAPTVSPPEQAAAFPWVESATAVIPATEGAWPGDLTGSATWFEDFSPGDIVVHANGRTITEEHMAWTYLTGNTHPLHFDRVYSSGLSGKMSGNPIVYGGLVFAWLEGLASRDVSENALWELGFTEGYHTQPAFAGDTVAAISRVLACEALEDSEAAGIVTFQFIGVKDLSAADAVDEFGEDLFVKENDKRALGKEKIAAKIFEIERRLLIRRRGS